MKRFLDLADFSREEIMDLLCRLNRERHLTIAMVTHEREMAAYANRTIMFRDGLVDSGSHSVHSGHIEAGH